MHCHLHERAVLAQRQDRVEYGVDSGSASPTQTFFVVAHTGSVRRFWFELDTSQIGLRLGAGVTAWDEGDALQLLADAIGEMPAVLSITSDVDVSSLDAGHVIPNMLSPDKRGIWFPAGFRGV